MHTFEQIWNDSRPTGYVQNVQNSTTNEQIVPLLHIQAFSYKEAKRQQQED
jgi:hypothetical protein